MSGETHEVGVVVIGAGQSGLAASWHLRDRGIDHVVLERHDVAHAWATQRWDSLRLLTPNWLCRLPGGAVPSPDPDGYISAAEVVDLLRSFAEGLPVRTGVAVDAVRTVAGGFDVMASDRTWRCRSVISASGACRTPCVPDLARDLPARLQQIHSLHYRSPDQVGAGDVLVVGASASGTQIADELVRSGRSVTLAVGRHRRMVRSYRGHDIFWWMEQLGLLDERPVEHRPLPSMQLVGTPDQRQLDLATLRAAGVTVVGRVVGVAGEEARLGTDLDRDLADSQRQLDRLLDRIDGALADGEIAVEAAAPDRPEAIPSPVTSQHLDLRPFGTVVWATGFTPDHPWLEADLLDDHGFIVHDLGQSRRPGIFVLGEPFSLRRRSGFIDGAGPDAEEIVERVRAHVGTASTPAI